jgi:hypothetical protein
MPSNQEIFNLVYTKLAAQGCPSVDDKGMCRYRGPNGTKCAAGYLISEENYSPDLEGLRVDNLAVWEAVNLPYEHFDLICALQSAHDHFMTISFEEWKAKMRRIAAQFKLNTNVIDIQS